MLLLLVQVIMEALLDHLESPTLPALRAIHDDMFTRGL